MTLITGGAYSGKTEFAIKKFNIKKETPTMAINKYYDSDCNLGVLDGKTVANSS